MARLLSRILHKTDRCFDKIRRLSHDESGVVVKLNGKMQGSEARGDASHEGKRRYPPFFSR
jgi:hypothetical protein